VAVKKDELMVRNCCDFKALEAACAEYAEHRLAEQTVIVEPSTEADRRPEKERPSTLAQIRDAQRERHEHPRAPKKSGHKNDRER
jgi:hypothetical protein